MLNKSIQTNVITGKKIISVYGLGNVGGPLAAAWMRVGAKIIGVDISKELLEQIQDGSSHKKEPFISETFTNAIKKKKLLLTSDGIFASKKSDIKIVAVPVGLKNNKIDLRALIEVCSNISKGLKKGDTVIISPSLAPGTTKNIILPILENNSRLKVERDFYLIYNPERIFEGRALQDIESNYPAIISGAGEKSLLMAENLLKLISKKGVLKMPDLESAEAEKLFEGVYRDVNIALANELAEFCEKAGINYWEVRKGANSQPFCHLHYPGTGVGGLCIPVYPRFVIDEAKKRGTQVQLVEFSRHLNDLMPKKCVKDAISLLLKNKKNPKNAKIAILGLGFRGEVTDSRLSPTYAVVKEFIKTKSNIFIHDPFISNDPILPKNVKLSSKLDEVLENADLVFISTDHKMYSSLNENSFKKTKKPLLIYDGRNILNRENLIKAKIITIGNGKL